MVITMVILREKCIASKTTKIKKMALKNLRERKTHKIKTCE